MNVPVQPMPLVAFGIETVAELTGLSERQLQRWDRIGFFAPSFADPNRRRPGSRIYSRADVVALKVIAKLRELGIPFSQLTALLPALAPGKNGAIPLRFLYVAGKKHVFLSQDEAVAAARHNGKHAEPTIIEVAAVVAELNEGIERLRERKPEEIGQVTRRRGVMSGVPIIAGTRIPTETIAWYHNHGYSIDWILREFSRLTPADVRAAVDYELAREVKHSDPVLVHR